MEFLKPTQSVIDRAMSRLKNEYQAHFHYQNLTAWCECNGWQKAANFFRVEALAELEHAKKIMDWLTGWNVAFEIPNPSMERIGVTSLEDCIDMSYEIEAALWKAYNDDAIAVMAEDTSAYDLFRKMVKIQTESVAEYRTLIDMYRNCDGNVFLYESVAFK